MMYCANQTCPLDRVFDGASHGFFCPACGKPLVMTTRQMLRGGVIFLSLGIFGSLVTAAVLTDASWGEIVRLESPITPVMLTVATLSGAIGLVFGTVQLAVGFRYRRQELALARAAAEAAVERAEG